MTKKSTKLNELLPSVHRSEIGDAIFNSSFNKFLTKQDLIRKVGRIGNKNPNALVDSRIKESTPRRQAFQLQPVIKYQRGIEEKTFSFETIEDTLKYYGIDFDEYQRWGKSQVFNWVPPINMDMLINYSDYFWTGPNDSIPQYLTIENRCRKSFGKLEQYNKTVSSKPLEYPIISINGENNSFIIEGSHVDLFVEKFVFYIRESSLSFLNNKYWTVKSNSYDYSTDHTEIVVEENITYSEQPLIPQDGDLWFDGVTIWEYSSAIWNVVTTFDGTISVKEIKASLEASVNCNCYGTTVGWDQTLWDDNNVDDINDISFDTENDWVDSFKVVLNSYTLNSINLPGNLSLSGNSRINVGDKIVITDGIDEIVLTSSDVQYVDPETVVTVDENIIVDVSGWYVKYVTSDIWYDTSNDELKQYSEGWNTIFNDFSQVLAQSTGNNLWDGANTSSCDIQQYNDWSQNNYWVHKTQLTSFTNVRQAQRPIIEYNSKIELSNAFEIDYDWGYRSYPGEEFISIQEEPTLLELEPITEYFANNTIDGWEIYLLGSPSRTYNRNHSQTFKEGFKFLVKDDRILRDEYTVESSTFREITSSDPAQVSDYIGTLVTVVKISENFASPIQGDTSYNNRIEPRQTSKGDGWKGYHVHWCLLGTSTKPAKQYQINPLLQRSLTDVNYKSTTVDLTGIKTVGDYYQEYVINSETNNVGLDAKLKYSNSDIFYASVGDLNSIRVFLNGHQVFDFTANYSTIPVEVLINKKDFTNVDLEYISSITFDNSLKIGDTVRIEVGNRFIDSIGCEIVPVRTETDDDLFQNPEFKHLSKYCFYEQRANLNSNSYPLFNVYDIDNNLVTTNEIFSYVTNEQANVDPFVYQRICVESGNNYKFQQKLILENDELGCYLKTNEPSSEYWYDGQTVRIWNEGIWEDALILTDVNDNIIVQYPFIQAEEPVEGIMDGSLWFDTFNNILLRYQTSDWFEVEFVDNEINPNSMTIWQKGLNSEEYIPKYVDGDKNEITIGDIDGDWEVLEQFIYNLERENRQYVDFKQLFYHFNSIIKNQEAVLGLPKTGISALLQDEINYGVGGSIKLYNDGMDQLVSIINSELSPTRLIEFAEEQYEYGLFYLLELSKENIVSWMTEVPTIENITRMEQFISDKAVNAFEMDDRMKATYFDSSFNDTIKHWIGTLPLFGFTGRVVPHINRDDSLSIYELVHHDGHRSNINQVPTKEFLYFANRVVNTIDSRSNQPFGVSSTDNPPDNLTDYLNHFILINGVYWFNSSTKTLYKFNNIGFYPFEPSIVYNGVQLPENSKYYNTSNDTEYELVSGVWQPVTVIGDRLISSWQIIDLRDLYANILLNVENLLYSACDKEMKDFSYIEQYPEFDDVLYERFDLFVKQHGIDYPFENLEYNVSNAFTWNYQFSPIVNPPKVETIQTAGYWRQLYTNVYGTPYPHLEPWKLQNYSSKPEWWDTEYLDDTGLRRWNSVMWDNIINLIIPVGFRYYEGTISSGDYLADGVDLPEYDYFSVNITGSPVSGYEPDGLFPPYFNTVDPVIRSIYTDLNELQAVDYAYTENGGSKSEWMWNVSIEKGYDKLVSYFKLEPIKFISDAIGETYRYVNELKVSDTLNTVLNHENNYFHGDLLPDNQMYNSYGLNQWMVNFARYNSIDGYVYRNSWKNWDVSLGYLFNNVIVDDSLFVSSLGCVDVNEYDYSVKMGENIGDILYVDSFDVTAINTPPRYTSLDNAEKWTFEISTPSLVNNEISYYRPRIYPGLTNPADDTIELFKFNIISIVSSSSSVEIFGNYSDWLNGTVCTITNTVSNNGVYEVLSASYNSVTNTSIVILDGVLSDESSVGYCSFNITPEISTADIIFFSAYSGVPLPLAELTPYFLKNISGNVYKVYETKNDLAADINVEFSTEFLVNSGLILRTFYDAYNKRWCYYKTEEEKFNITLPYKMYGMQSFINFTVGYKKVKETEGVIYSEEHLYDQNLDGSRTTWENTLETFINYMYYERSIKFVQQDNYQFIATDSNSFRFISQVPNWSAKQAIRFVTNGTLPAPLQENVTYYYHPITNGFKISYIKTPINPSDYVTILVFGTGNYAAERYVPKNLMPTFEFNPTKYNFWIKNEYGLIADTTTAPYDFSYSNVTVFDQYGSPLKIADYNVYRSNDRTHFKIRNPDSGKHFGGARLFRKDYEHILTFNNYNQNNQIIYDPFIGVNINQFYVEYETSENPTGNGDLDGYVRYNRDLLANFETNADNLRRLYDVNKLYYRNEISRQARHLVGYDNEFSFLTKLNQSPHSQFQFYRGMIQQKGSRDALIAYLNSIRYVSADIDQYWAYKDVEYGSSKIKAMAKMRLYNTDVNDSIVKMVFANQGEIGHEFLTEYEDNDFNLVTIKDARWVNRVEVEKQFVDAEFFAARIHKVINIIVSDNEPENINSIWIEKTVIDNLDNNSTINSFKRYTVDSWEDYSETDFSITVFDNVVYINLTEPNDLYNVILKDLNGTIIENEFILENSETIKFGIVNNNVLVFGKSYFNENVVISCYRPDNKQFSPLAVYSEKDYVNLARPEFWHPQYGIFNQNGIKNVKWMNINDPAKYNVSLGLQNTSIQSWGKEHKDEIWFDLTAYSTVPYSDKRIFENLNDRIKLWGKQSEWSRVKLYQWVESDIHPSQWFNNRRIMAVADNKQLFYSGTPKKHYFRRSRNYITDFTIVDNCLVFNDDVLYIGQFISFVDVDIYNRTEELTFYYVDENDDGNFEVYDVYGTRLDISSGYDDKLILPAYTDETTYITEGWKPVGMDRQTFYFHQLNEVYNPVITLDNNIFKPSEFVSVYVNGYLKDGSLVVGEDNTIRTEIEIVSTDIIDVVRSVPTDIETGLADFGTTLSEYKEDYQYSQRQEIIEGRLVNKYYFWVENVSVDVNNYTCLQTRQLLEKAPDNHFFVLEPRPSWMINRLFGYGIDLNQPFDRPLIDANRNVIEIVYRGLAIKDIANIVNRENVILDIPVDQTLRDFYEEGMKNKHTEYQMFRETDFVPVPKKMWDKLTESLIGYSLVDSNNVIPSKERQLYDEKYGTTTRIGISDEQALIDSAIGIEVITATLLDRNNDFYPIIGEDFLYKFDLSNVEEVKNMMDEIYATFPTNGINKIWFNCLKESLSTARIDDIFATSFISLSGVQLLNVNGVFE